ncbi:MAG: SIMPL domain-containing protein [Actinobacteria bacterium]|nr:SIMPL domain-containing protein [Actinomycetota bacterium]
MQPTITVTGVGATLATPDVGAFHFGVTSEGETARDALTANSASMERVLAALEQVGVAREDVQTSQVSTQRRHGESGRGYSSYNGVTVRLRSLDEAGAVIDAAIAAGADDVSGPQLGHSDSRSVYREALPEAVADARAKAEVLAAAAGYVLGELLELVEGGSAPRGRSRSAPSFGAMLAPIEAGQEDIVAVVTATFEVLAQAR